MPFKQTFKFGTVLSCAVYTVPVNLLVGVAGTLEWYGHEFSWKIYSLLFCMILMFCAASGYIIYIKVGENELRIEKKKE